MAPTPKTTERPTLKTIAELSGLAVPTVSRALNDAPDIGNATKARVQQIAREIGYRPDRAGLRLRTGKTNVIALIISTQHEVIFNTARLITSIATATRGTPYHMIVTPYFPDQDPMEPVRYVTETRSADGLILNQTRPEDPRIDHLMRIGFPFATHGRTNWSDRHPFYDFDNGTFGALCVTRLAARGRTRLLMVPPPRAEFYAIEMVTSAEREANRLGVTLDVLSDTTSYDSGSAIQQAVRQAYLSGNAPDGIIAASADATMSIATALEAAGKQIGRDVDLIAKETTEILRIFRKEILVVREDVRRAGEFLGRAVMQAIDAPELPPMQHLEQPEA